MSREPDDKMVIFRLLLKLERAIVESQQIPLEDAIIKLYDDMKLRAETAEKELVSVKALLKSNHDEYMKQVIK